MIQFIDRLIKRWNAWRDKRDKRAFDKRVDRTISQLMEQSKANSFDGAMAACMDGRDTRRNRITCVNPEYTKKVNEMFADKGSINKYIEGFKENGRTSP